MNVDVMAHLFGAVEKCQCPATMVKTEPREASYNLRAMEKMTLNELLFAVMSGPEAPVM